MPSRQIIHKSRDKRRKVPPKLWEGVDWTQTDVAIARHPGCTTQNVNATRHVLGRRKPPMSERRRQQFAALPRGLSLREIGERLGIGDTTARFWCQHFGYEPGGYHSIRKEIAAEFASLPPGLTYKQIVRRLNVSMGIARKWTYIFGYRARLAYWARGPGDGLATAPPEANAPRLPDTPHS